MQTRFVLLRQERDQWCALLNMVMNLRVSKILESSSLNEKQLTSKVPLCSLELVTKICGDSCTSQYIHLYFNCGRTVSTPATQIEKPGFKSQPKDHWGFIWLSLNLLKKYCFSTLIYATTISFHIILNFPIIHNHYHSVLCNLCSWKNIHHLPWSSKWFSLWFHIWEALSLN